MTLQKGKRVHVLYKPAAFLAAAALPLLPLCLQLLLLCTAR